MLTPPDEIPFLRDEYREDEKNYHGWSFPIWYAERWNKQQEVYELAKYQIQEDCRYISAWTTRKTVGDMLNVNPMMRQPVFVRLAKMRQFAICLLAIRKGDSDLRSRIRPLCEELPEKSRIAVR
jgi:hypothetical protein